MKICGIGGSTHDFSACLLENGEITIAIEEQRLSRERHAEGMHSAKLQCVDYCLNNRNLKEDDIEMYITSDILYPSIYHSKKYINRLIKINHHMAHASHAFYASGFEKAAIIVIDGIGSFLTPTDSETITLAYGDNTKINILDKVVGKVPFGSAYASTGKVNSFGSLYSFFNQICGFAILDSGKLMGLASYGQPRYIDQIKLFAKVTESSPLGVDIEIGKNIFKNFVKMIMEKRTEEEQFKVKADIACSIQAFLEDSVFRIMNMLYEQTKCKNLCYCGGVAYNSVLNGKIKKNTKFEHVYIPPNAGDAGISMGAALYAYHNFYKQPRLNRISRVYYGIRYSEKEIESVLLSNNLVSFKRLDNKELIYTAAKCLASGEIVGWFQGGSEVGPRALGNRSILADPRIADMKEKINEKVKFREMFRPYAPCVLEEQVDKYFETDFPNNPYMLYVGDVINPVIPAATHVDMTARLQTVGKEENERFYSLIETFGKFTEVPIVLNTSFNIKGEPIVETPEDAVNSFLRCDMDRLFIENYMVQKNIYHK